MGLWDDGTTGRQDYGTGRPRTQNNVKRETWNVGRILLMVNGFSAKS